jgi:hypothetical protein
LHRRAEARARCAEAAQAYHGYTRQINTGYGRLYITINEDEKGLCELFAMMGKSGGCATSQTEATGRLVSLALRSGVDPASIVDQLKGIRCPSPAWVSGATVYSCADAIAHVLEEYIARGKAKAGGNKAYGSDNLLNVPRGPECGSMVSFARLRGAFAASQSAAKFKFVLSSWRQVNYSGFRTGTAILTNA